MNSDDTTPSLDQPGTMTGQILRYVVVCISKESEFVRDCSIAI